MQVERIARQAGRRPIPQGKINALIAFIGIAGVIGLAAIYSNLNDPNIIDFSLSKSSKEKPVIIGSDYLWVNGNTSEAAPRQAESVERPNVGKEINETQTISNDQRKGNKGKEEVSNDVISNVALTGILNETNAQNSAWPTQIIESRNEKEVQAAQHSSWEENISIPAYSWKVCNVTAGPDYIPCLDNVDAIRKLRSTKHYEHRERHCPEEAPTCLVSLPTGYKRPIEWPISRDKVWYDNVPHNTLAVLKRSQNWVKVSGEYLTFPGGGTQFKHGALHYIEFLQECSV
ncbi:hypothetical protein Scep_002475 [Stephania cephalantha]|uniref:Methyltransferase n=1 Tax=Stephania cephalantha TaxID=152367 RepID=A0AAP0LEB9_9MAGN